MSIQQFRLHYDFFGIAHLVYYQDGEMINASMFQRITYLLRSKPLLGLITLFAPAAGLIVFVFFLYHLHLVYKGITTNETIKWDDLKCAIAEGRISKMSRDCLKFNREYKPGETLQDYLIDGNEMIEIQSVDVLRNIYDKSRWNNFMQVLYPKKM